VAEHYISAAKDFFDGEGFGKSWEKRKNAEIPTIKKVIPLHRIARDLLPRAVYMLKKNPHGVSDEELFSEGETSKIAQKIAFLFANQAEGVSFEEIHALAQEIQSKLAQYWKEEYSEEYQKNLERLKTKKERTERQNELTNKFVKKQKKWRSMGKTFPLIGKSLTDPTAQFVGKRPDFERNSVNGKNSQ
jgi:hypothetical protein